MSNFKEYGTSICRPNPFLVLDYILYQLTFGHVKYPSLSDFEGLYGRVIFGLS